MVAAQHGVVARVQMIDLGFSSKTIDFRLQTSRLHRVHQGVYAVSPARLDQRARWMAAVLAYPGSLLSHRSAAALWGLIDLPAGRPEVTVPTRARAATRLRVCRTRSFDPADVARRDGIPVTAVARTLLDLAAVAPLRLERALEAAERLGLFDLRAVKSVLRRRRGCRGAGRLRRALAIYEPLPFTRSELERRFAKVVRRAGLPPPAMNAWVEGCEVDALWEEQRLVLELDGYEFHGTRAAFERDRRRDEELELAGYSVLRVTWRRLGTDPAGVASTLRRLAGRALPPPAPETRY